MFDLALYVSLRIAATHRAAVRHAISPASLDPPPGEATAYADTLVCHELTLTPYNFSLGPVGQAGDGSSTGGHGPGRGGRLMARRRRQRRRQGRAQRAKAEAAADIATSSDGIAWDDC